MTWSLLAINALVFLVQVSLGSEVRHVVDVHGFVPARVGRVFASKDPAALLELAQSILTSMFLHGGWAHVVGNLLYLRVFGDNVEDRFGWVQFGAFYVLVGVAGALGQYAADPMSSVPVIGASGAIAGVLGAYIVLFPTARIVTLFPVFIFLTFIEIPAVVFLGIWAAQQLLNGYLSLDPAAPTQVAWFAHLAGFAFGVSVGLLYRLTRGRSKRRKKGG